LEEVKIGFIRTAVFLPREITVLLPKGRKRVKGLMNGAPFSTSIQYKRDGTQFFAINAELREAAAIRPGDPVKVLFTLIKEEAIEIAPELETVIALDDGVGRVWNGFTAGLQKNLTHYVDTAKKLDSRIRKSFELIKKSKLTKAAEQPPKRKTKG
jgi:hypothetical protein